MLLPTEYFLGCVILLLFLPNPLAITPICIQITTKSNAFTLARLKTNKMFEFGNWQDAICGVILIFVTNWLQINLHTCILREVSKTNLFLYSLPAFASSVTSYITCVKYFSLINWGTDLRSNLHINNWCLLYLALVQVVNLECDCYTDLVSGP